MTLIADAYSHIGLPRYGGVDEFMRNRQRFGIDKSVVALFNAVPDFASLFAVIRDNPDTVRGIGIPFGRTEAQRLELADMQMRAGIAGIRLEPAEALGNPALLKRLGERGMWAVAINPFQSEELSRMYLDWLAQYPEARIASPHLLYAGDAAERLRRRQTVRELLDHPRFHAIFSRHGGLGSIEPYPHRDFIPWVSFVLERAGLERVMWGSEYPVVYSRNESMPDCIAWLDELGAGLGEAQLRAAMHDNAARVFFGAPGPACCPVEVPPWVDEQFDRSQTVRIYNREGFELPLDAYGRLLNGYLRSDEWRAGASFADYLVRRISSML